MTNETLESAVGLNYVQRDEIARYREIHNLDEFGNPVEPGVSKLFGPNISSPDSLRGYWLIRSVLIRSAVTVKDFKKLGVPEPYVHPER